MYDSDKWAAIVVASIAAVFIAIIVVAGLSSHANRRADERVRMACIEQGMQMIENSCVNKSQ